MSAFPTPVLRTLRRDWSVLCETIGERRAGSPAERRAAGFMAERFTALGFSSVGVEEFPCLSLQRGRSRVAAKTGGKWNAVESEVLVGTPGTPGGCAVEGEGVWLELPEQLPALTPGCLRGKIAVLFGPLPTEVEQHRRLVAAAPAAVIHVDERLPFSWAKSDGVYPTWVRRHGMPTIVTVPYTAAWQWRVAGVRRLRVQAEVTLRAATSQNVVAELTGRAPHLPALVLTAHHDTQCGNPGADDNASGVVALLALAQMLAGRTHRRTIRFISFGCEEQLSVGAAAYVQAHRATMAAHNALAAGFDAHPRLCATERIGAGVDGIGENLEHRVVDREAPEHAAPARLVDRRGQLDALLPEPQQHLAHAAGLHEAGENGRDRFADA